MDFSFKLKAIEKALQQQGLRGKVRIFKSYEAFEHARDNNELNEHDVSIIDDLDDMEE